MDKKFYKIAAKLCQEVYQDNIDLGTTEFRIDIIDVEGKPYQWLTICGTNETKDWKENLDPRQKNGLKKSSYDAAIEISRNPKFLSLRDPYMPLIVSGHSLGGAHAIAFHAIFKGSPFRCSDNCIAFAPARCISNFSKKIGYMPWATVFIDPDDPVSFFGRILFGLPDCKTVKAKNDYFGFKFSDHDIDNWVRFTAGG